ncbi:hypothetical protein DRE_01536 [Drechslerella stenobrocha 248]|uniref:F-box domain-containing protein n=1 Tax=Drechslerella stenobrocha 248 TaxID=1043628 RepID=W7HKV3_9PEZI|nr:hypothetical protein DRE_01536 [Drechslerella stenobrocha 248]
MATQSPTGCVVPMEIQFLILKACHWTQHPTLARVCRAWRQVVPEYARSRYRHIVSDEIYAAGQPYVHRAIHYFSRPWVHRGYVFTRDDDDDRNAEPGHLLPLDFGYFGSDPLIRWEGMPISASVRVWYFLGVAHIRGGSNITGAEDVVTIRGLWDGVVEDLDDMQLMLKSMTVGEKIFCHQPELNIRRTLSDDGVKYDETFEAQIELEFTDV